MRILYGFSNCSYKKYNELFKNSDELILPQAQKYHSLMASGLAANGADITCISGLPVNRSLTKKIRIRGGNDTENGVKYHYFSTFNLPAVRPLMIMIKSFFRTLFFGRKNSVAVCDILNISVVLGMLAAAKMKGLRIIGIVTDIPSFFSPDGGGVSEKIGAKCMKKFDGYVLLTRQMNELVNPHNKPYIVVEGQSDKTMAERENLLQNKIKPKVLMYAGSIQKIYGIGRLTEAFISLSAADWELHVYGDGDYREELEKISLEHDNVKYCGVKLNSEIVEAEISASLLINPRPTDEEYTKYSFPSKNMEYMASGTPLITTKLPGMPPEYNSYVYLIDDESPEGIAATLKSAFSRTPDELHDMGSKAKAFVMNEKNNICQAEKIISVLKLT